jgi:hypothetical protein
MREARATLDALAAALGAGEMGLQEWRVARQAASARLDRAEQVLASAVQTNPVAALVGAEDVDEVWKSFDLSRKRAAIAFMMTVKVFPARRGRLPGGAYFDRESVRIEWK